MSQSKEQYMANYPVEMQDEQAFEFEMRKRAIESRRKWHDSLDEFSRKWAKDIQDNYNRGDFRSYTEMRNFPTDGLKLQGEGWDEQQNCWYLLFQVVDHRAAKVLPIFKEQRFCY